MSDTFQMPLRRRASSTPWLFGLLASLLLAFVAFGASLAGAQTRAVVRSGHAADVIAVAFSPDGSSFASASADHTIKIWSASRNSELRTLSGHTGMVFSIAYSPDSRYLVSSSADKTTTLWSVATGAPLRNFTGEYMSADFSSDGKMLATIGVGQLRLWSVSDGKLLRTYPVPETLTGGLRLSRDGRLAAWGGDKNAYVLELGSGRILWTFETNTKHCLAVALSPDGNSIAFPVGDGRVQLRDLRSGALSRTLAPTPSPYPVPFHVPELPYNDLSFSPDGQALTAVGQYVRSWNPATGEAIDESPMQVSLVESVAYSPDGQTLVLGRADGVVGNEPVPKAASPASERDPLAALRQRFKLRVSQDPSDSFNKADSTARKPSYAEFSPDGKSLLTAGWPGKTLNVWNLTTGRISSSIDAPVNGANLAHYSQDGKTLVVAGVDGAAVLDAATNAVIRRIGITAINPQTSPDNRFLGTYFPNGSAVMFDLTEDRSFREIYRPDGLPVTALAFSGDNKTFALGSTNETIVIWAFGARAPETLSAGSPSIQALAYSPDGKWLAAAAKDGSVFMWDMARRERRRVRGPGGNVNGLTFSPDGHILASIEDGGPVVFRDTTTGYEIGRYAQTEVVIGGLRFSPDGKRFTTRSASYTTVWDISGRQLASIYEFEDGSSVVLTPEGYYDTSSDSAEANVSVRVGTALYPVSAYRERFYRPDLVRAALQGLSLNALARLDQVKAAPNVSVAPIAANLADESTSVKLNLSDRGGGIGRVRLFVNGAAVLEDNLTARDLQAGVQGVQRTYVIHLPEGRSDVNAVAFNADNSMQGASNVVSVITARRQVET